MGWWDMLLDDAAATAAAYDERGWETLELHTADVTPLDGTYGDEVGLSVLVPDDEFDALEAMLADGSVDGFEVYRTTAMGYVALLLVLEDEVDERAILLPAYYSTGDESVEGLFAQALADGELALFLRNLAEERVEVTLAEPALLAPPETGDGDATGGDEDGRDQASGDGGFVRAHAEEGPGDDGAGGDGEGADAEPDGEGDDLDPDGEADGP